MKGRKYRGRNQSVADSTRRSALVRRLQASAADLAQLPSNDVDELTASLYRTLAELGQPEPEVRHAHELRYAAEVALAIERGRVVKGLRPYIDRTLDLVSHLLKGETAQGKVAAPSLQDLAVLKEFIDLHKFQLDKITVGEYKKAVYSAAGAIGGRMQAIINSNR